MNIKHDFHNNDTCITTGNCHFLKFLWDHIMYCIVGNFVNLPNLPSFGRNQREGGMQCLFSISDFE